MNLHSILVLLIFLSFPSSLAAEGQNPLAKEQKPPNDEITAPVEFRWTLPGCLEFQWLENDKSKLPMAIKVTNPFLEPVLFYKVLNSNGNEDFEIEYYDTYLKGWRKVKPFPGVSQLVTIEIKSGEHAILPISKEYWNFINETIQSFKLQDPVRIRLACHFEYTSLQSPEFNWNRTEKKVVVNEILQPESK